MAFPSSPLNGQTAVVNGITYTYNSTVKSWTRQSISTSAVNPAIYVGNATATTVATLVDTVPVTGNVFLRWTVTAKDTVNSRFTSTVLDSINDGTNVYYTQYGTIKSNQSYNVATFTSNISSGNINLYAVGDSSGVTVTYERLVLGTNPTTGYINVGPAGPGVSGNVVLGNTTVTGISVGSSVNLTSTEAYDLDDVSNYVDGRTNTFALTYNGSTVTVTNAWNLDVTVNGARQPAFKYNNDLVWFSYTLPANRGYCLDYTGNLRFADALPAQSTVVLTTKPGTNSQTTKKYPFNPLDIVLGM